MHDASLLRKIVAPALPATFLHRTALVTYLQEAIAPEQHTDGAWPRYKLVLCCAPAGYGKTTLLADFACSTSLPCCWYFLDRADTDPTVFLRTLLASIRQAFPQFGLSLDALFSHPFPDLTDSTAHPHYSTIDALCTTLATEIPERFALILCNYEEINESMILTDVVNSLLQRLPPQATIIIESRVMPDISLTSFIIHDAMCGLDSNALRFSAQDITELAHLQGLPTLTDTEAEQLVMSFDGWIAGLLLGTRVGDARFRWMTQRTSTHERPAPLQGKPLAEYKRKTLFTYVVDDVLKRDTTTYIFLQNISILQQIEPLMCNMLFDITDAAERLAYLEQQGLFVTAYENAPNLLYTCHPVIRDLLSEQLRYQEPERFRALHQQAATLWLARHNNEQAMYHILEIDAYDQAVPIILAASEHLLHQGQRETLTRWLHALPATLQKHHPQLLLFQASMALDQGQHDAAIALLVKAEELVLPSDETEIRLLQAEIAILRGKAYCQIGEYFQAQTLCQQVLLQLPSAAKALRAAAEMRLGVCANLQGDFTAGITHLQQALHIWADQPPLNHALDIYNALANTYYWMGNLLLASHHLTRVLDVCEQLHDVQGKGNALILQGLIEQDQGLAAKAEATFLQALALARTAPYAPRVEAYALVNLGTLFVEQKKYAQALTYAEEGLTLARTFGNRSLINAALADLALSYLFLGDSVSALLTVEKMEMQALSEKDVGYERAWHDLTLGMILLAQQHYQEAERCLTTIEHALNTTDFTRGRFQAKLRLAACRVAQHQPEQARNLLEEVMALLVTHRTYLHLVQIELQWLPALLPIIQNYLPLAELRAALGMAEPVHMAPVQNEPRISSHQVSLIKNSVPKLTIYAFGEPTVLLDEQPIKRWRMTHTMELFFFLLDAAHPVSKEVILTALWPEYDERTSHIFHDTVYQLRKLLGESSVVFRSAGYSLDLASCYGEHIWYDVHEFQRLRSEAEQALRAANEGHVKEALLEMVQLYRGDYGRSFYSDWCTFRRDELRTMYVEARRQLAHMAWKAEAWSESADHWRQMLRIDNCLEEAHYGLIRCYVRQGKRGMALRQYQACQDILQEELGVQPSEALQNLYRHLTAKRSAE